MEKQENQRFVNWLSKKLKATPQQLSEMASESPEKIKALYAEFKKEDTGDSEEQPTYREGGKLSYIECLQAFKKGGSIENCKCGGKAKIKKAFFGAILNGVKGAGMLAKGATALDTAAKVGTAGAKLGKTFNTVNNVAKAGTQIAGMAQNFMKPPATPGVVPQMYAPSTPNINPQVPPGGVTKTNPMPLGMQRTVPSFTPIKEQGGKLVKKVLKKSFKLGGLISEFAGGGKISEFGLAFRKSRAAGEKEFTYKGKRYNTRTKDEEDKAQSKGAPKGWSASGASVATKRPEKAGTPKGWTEEESTVTAKKPSAKAPKGWTEEGATVTAKRPGSKPIQEPGSPKGWSTEEATVTANRRPNAAERETLNKKVTPRPSQTLTRSGKIQEKSKGGLVKKNK